MTYANIDRQIFLPKEASEATKPLAHRKWLFFFLFWLLMNVSARRSLIFVSSYTFSLELHLLLWRLRVHLVLFRFCFFFSFHFFFLRRRPSSSIFFISFSTLGYACLTFDEWLMSKVQVYVWTFSTHSFKPRHSRTHPEWFVGSGWYITFIVGLEFFHFLFHHR